MRRVIHAWAAALALIAACSSSAEPSLEDFDVARAHWLANMPVDYTFEFAVATSWTPKSEFVRVNVVGGEVSAVTKLDGTPLPGWNAPSIEAIWQELIKARSDGELNSAMFNQRGVPVESDYGPWPVDGGIHYSVRHFAEKR